MDAVSEDEIDCSNCGDPALLLCLCDRYFCGQYCLSLVDHSWECQKARYIFDYKRKPVVNHESFTFSEEDEIVIKSKVFSLLYICFAESDPEIMATLCFLNSTYYKYYKHFQFKFEIPLCSDTRLMSTKVQQTPYSLEDVGKNWSCLKLDGLIELIPIARALRAYKTQYLHSPWHLGVFLIIVEEYWMFDQLSDNLGLQELMGKDEWNAAVVMNGTQLAYYFSSVKVKITSPFRMAMARSLHLCRGAWISISGVRGTRRAMVENWLEYLKLVICCCIGEDDKVRFALSITPKSIYSNLQRDRVENRQLKVEITKTFVYCWYNSWKWELEVGNWIRSALAEFCAILEMPVLSLDFSNRSEFYIQPDNNEWPLLRN